MGQGTLASPWEFRVLVLVAAETRAAAERQGFSVDARIAEHMRGLNACFNQADLRHHYRFVSIATRTAVWDTTAVPSVATTPEDEDLLLLYDERFGGNYASPRRVHIGSINVFGPDVLAVPLICHEFGHLRGALDVYNFQLSPQNSELPGAGYQWPGKSYMGTGLTGGTEWDALSRELLAEAGGDPSRAVNCAYHWLSTWQPPEIRIQVTAALGNPVGNAAVDVYREAPSQELERWFSGITAPDGVVALPPGLATTPEGAGWYYPLFVVKVSHAGEQYLSYYTPIDIAVPYRQGLRQLVLPAQLTEQTRYRPPTKIQVDLGVQAVIAAPLTVHVNETLARTVTISNAGPARYQGACSVQHYLSRDAQLDASDRPIGGYTVSLDLPAGESFQHFANAALSSAILAGDYYILVQIEPLAPGVSDPTAANDILASATTVHIGVE